MKHRGGLGRSWAVTPSPPVGTLFKLVQAGKERGESMQGSAALVPLCLPTPAAHKAQGPGSSFPAAPLGCIWPLCSQEEPRTSRRVSPQTCGLGCGIPPPSSACQQRSWPSFFGKDSNNSLFRLNTPVLGRNRSLLPSPALG